MNLDELKKELETAAPEMEPAVEVKKKKVKKKKVKKEAAVAQPVKQEKPCGIDSCKYSYGVRACDACIHRVKE